VRLFGTRRALPSTRSLISQFLFIGAARPLHINAVQGLHLAPLALADFDKLSRLFIKKSNYYIFFCIQHKAKNATIFFNYLKAVSA
jgi:hypothetical protein